MALSWRGEDAVKHVLPYSAAPDDARSPHDERLAFTSARGSANNEDVRQRRPQTKVGGEHPSWYAGQSSASPQRTIPASTSPQGPHPSLAPPDFAYTVTSPTPSPQDLPWDSTPFSTRNPFSLSPVAQPSLLAPPQRQQFHGAPPGLQVPLDEKDQIALNGFGQDVLDKAYTHMTFTFPVAFYQLCLLRMPMFYFGRVKRVLEDADLSMSDFEQMARTAAAEWKEKNREERREALDQINHISTYGVPHQAGVSRVTPAMRRFRDSWESFIDSLLREWKTQNVISALLMSALLSMLQIDAAAADVVTRTACVLSLIAALMSLLYGCLYIIRFGTMKRMHKASAWAYESRKQPHPIFWNVWVLLAMPVIWLVWSIVLFIVSIMSYIWRTGSVADPPERTTSATAALGTRIAITCVIGIGMFYLACICKTFARYGDRMDNAWKRQMSHIVQQILPDGTYNVTPSSTMSRVVPSGQSPASQGHGLQSHSTPPAFDYSHTSTPHSRPPGIAHSRQYQTYAEPVNHSPPQTIPSKGSAIPLSQFSSYDREPKGVSFGYPASIAASLYSPDTSSDPQSIGAPALPQETVSAAPKLYEGTVGLVPAALDAPAQPLSEMRRPPQPFINPPESISQPPRLPAAWQPNTHTTLTEVTSFSPESFATSHSSHRRPYAFHPQPPGEPQQRTSSPNAQPVQEVSVHFSGYPLLATSALPPHSSSEYPRLSRPLPLIPSASGPPRPPQIASQDFSTGHFWHSGVPVPPGLVSRCESVPASSTLSASSQQSREAVSRREAQSTDARHSSTASLRAPNQDAQAIPPRSHWETAGPELVRTQQVRDILTSESPATRPIPQPGLSYSGFWPRQIADLSARRHVELDFSQPALQLFKALRVERGVHFSDLVRLTTSMVDIYAPAVAAERPDLCLENTHASRLLAGTIFWELQEWNQRLFQPRGMSAILAFERRYGLSASDAYTIYIVDAPDISSRSNEELGVMFRESTTLQFVQRATIVLFVHSPPSSNPGETLRGDVVIRLVA